MIISATILALVVLSCLSVFQLLLASGQPLGDYAWGGQYKVLPKKLRISSAASIILYAVFALFLLSKSNILNIIQIQPVINVGIWIISGYLSIGVLMNLVSKNKKEQAIMTPTALLLAATFLIVALG